MNLHGYRKTVVENTDRVQIVLMLYDGAINHMKMARTKITNGDMMTKGQHFSKATAIISELSNVLDMEKGGEISSNLRKLYDYVLAELLRANMHNDLEALEHSEAVINTIRSGWKEMMTSSRQEQAAPVHAAV